MGCYYESHNNGVGAIDSVRIGYFIILLEISDVSSYQLIICKLKIT